MPSLGEIAQALAPSTMLIALLGAAGCGSGLPKAGSPEAAESRRNQVDACLRRATANSGLADCLASIAPLDGEIEAEQTHQMGECPVYAENGWAATSPAFLHLLQGTNTEPVADILRRATNAPIGRVCLRTLAESPHESDEAIAVKNEPVSPDPTVKEQESGRIETYRSGTRVVFTRDRVCSSKGPAYDVQVYSSSGLLIAHGSPLWAFCENASVTITSGERSGMFDEWYDDGRCGSGAYDAGKQTGIWRYFPAEACLKPIGYQPSKSAP